MRDAGVVSESRGGGPGSVTRPLMTGPRAAPPPVPPTKAMTPRAPAVAPPSPAVGAPRAAFASTTATAPAKTPAQRKQESEPPPGGWDATDADTVTSFPEPDELPSPTPRNLPPVKASPPPAAGAPATYASPPTAAPATPHSPGTARGPYQTSPGVGVPQGASRTAGTTASAMATGGLGSAMREEVWAIVRAAVEEAMGPLVARQRELEGRVERAERFADAASRGRQAGAGIPNAAPQTAPQGGGGSTATSRLASIPVAFSPSVAPPAFAAPSPLLPRTEIAPASVTNPGMETIPDLAASRSPAMAHPGPRPAMPSLPPTGTYGVTVMESIRPKLDLDAVGDVDIAGFDGGRRKRMVGIAVVIIMLLIIAGVVTMTLASHA